MKKNAEDSVCDEGQKNWVAKGEENPQPKDKSDEKKTY